MGELVCIKDLAEQFIRFWDYEPGKDITIETISLHLGERLHETFTANREKVVLIEFKHINKLVQRKTEEFPLEFLLAELTPICSFDPGIPDTYSNRKPLRAALRE